MPSTTDAWNDLNNAVLNVFNVVALTAGGVRRALPAIPEDHIRTALQQHVEWGYLTANRGVARTTYTLTEAGRRHLANTMKVA